MKKSYFAIFAVAAVCVCVYLAIDPAFMDILADEYSLLEDLSVGLFAAAFLLSLAILTKHFIKKSDWKFWLLISVLAAIFVGEDISWGIRYLGFKVHKISGIDFDSLHDFLSISVASVKLTRDYIRSIGITDFRSIAIIAGSASFAVIAAYISARFFIKNKKAIFEFFARNLKREPAFFLILCIFLLLVSSVVDDDNLVGFPHKVVVEEVMEFLAALALLFVALSGLKELSREPQIPNNESRNAG